MTKQFLASLGITIDTDEISDEEGQKLIAKALADNKDKADKNKKLVDKYSSELAELKKEKQDKMSDDEKKQAHYTEMETELTKLKRELAVKEKVNDLVELGYDKETAIKYANDELDGKSTIKYQKDFIASREEKLKADLLKNGGVDPNVKNGGNQTKFTKENFEKGLISMEEMNELKASNPTLYNEILGNNK